VDHSLKNTGLENLEQLLYLCICWFWILITASNYQLSIHQSIHNYQLYTILNSTFLPVTFGLSGCDFTQWGDRMIYSSGYSSSGILYFVTPDLKAIGLYKVRRLRSD